MFEHTRVEKFILKIRAIEDINLPAYKGSTLRGGFGLALKHATCALKRQECGSCLLRERCVYLYLFETPPPADSEMMRLYPSAPHPFVIEPPEDDIRTVRKGESFDFGLVLIGKALEYLPYFIYAFIHLGERGLGRGRGKFVLEKVLAVSAGGETSIYDYNGGTLRPYPHCNIKELLDARCRELGQARELIFHFLTPTRIKFDGRLVSSPEFHHLVRSLLRRLSSLYYFHFGEKLELDFRSLIDQARAIERTAVEVRWMDWERYSSRQKERMSLGGFTGRVVFSGDFNDFLPLFALGELVHVGKAASFGLGCYKMEHQP